MSGVRITNHEQIAKIEQICRDAGVSIGQVAKIPGAGEAISINQDASALVKPKGRSHGQHTTGVMNKVESSYAAHLDSRGLAWKFEAITLKLANRLHYRPDFMVIEKDGSISLHEVKAWWKASKRVGWAEKARVKWKAAADKFPMFRFVAAWQKDGAWEMEVYGE